MSSRIVKYELTGRSRCASAPNPPPCSTQFTTRKSPIVWCIGLIRKDHGEKCGPRSHKTRYETVRLAMLTWCPLGRVGQTAAHLLSLGPAAGATSQYRGRPRRTRSHSYANCPLL